MDVLENQVTEFMDELNQSWVNEADNAKKTRNYLNTTKMFGDYSKIIKKIKEAFIDARKRNKKKSFFG